ncbi:MAG: hypothetical protein ACLQVM_19280 [Terriglobia bacterium]
MQSKIADLFMMSLLVLVPLSTLSAQEAPTPVDKEAVRVGCQVTDYTMEPRQVDQAVIFKDPAEEQTVLFDVAEGGAIVSLKYRGIEHIWGHNGGGLIQMAFHNQMKAGPWMGDYNPTQAGDGSAMSPVTGVACSDTGFVDIMTMLLDFNHNNGFFENPLIAVWGGRVNNSVTLSYFSPYTLETRAHWVPNPAGEPRYYLQLDERFTHLTEEKIGPFGYDFADYEPWEFSVSAISPENCPCSSSATAYMAGGWYRDPEREVGLAVAMPSSNFPNNKISGGFNSDYVWRNRNFHLGSTEALDGIASKTFAWYVMVGSWQNALQFARHMGPQGGAQ